MIALLQKFFMKAGYWIHFIINVDTWERFPKFLVDLLRYQANVIAILLM